MRKCWKRNGIDPPRLNLLTSIRLRLYSGGMISDFDLLAQKVGDLASLAAALRRENAELRAHAAAIHAENGELSRRMQQAHDRVAALLAHLPQAEDAADAGEPGDTIDSMASVEPAGEFAPMASTRPALA